MGEVKALVLIKSKELLLFESFCPFPKERDKKEQIQNLSWCAESNTISKNIE